MIELNLRMAGGLICLLAVAHLGLPRYLRWREERATPLSREAHRQHYVFIVLLLALIGVLAFGFSSTLVEPATPLGRLVTGGLTLFWLARLISQLALVDPAAWRGSALHTAGHAVATVLWSYFTLSFGLAFAYQLLV